MNNVVNYNRACVVVPMYKSTLTNAELFSFNRTITVLSKWNVVVVAPKKLCEDLNRFKEKLGMDFCIMLFPDKYFASIEGYNKLLTSKIFYKSFFEYEYILIVQTDALVFHDSLNTWCDHQFSYIGSPWFKGLHEPEKPLSFYGVGNGGFSLRRTKDFLRVLSFPKYISFVPAVYDLPLRKLDYLKLLIKKYIFSYNFRPLFPRVNEDVFWGMMVPNTFDFFSVPNEEIAAEFSFEVEPRFLFELIKFKLPFGCHAWEKYDVSFWRDVCSKKGINLER